MGEQILAGHGASCEKVLGHPVTWVLNLKKIGVLFVGKNMDKQEALGGKPVLQACKQALVVAQMFKHFDGDNPIKTKAGVKRIDIGCADFEIVKTALCSPF